MTKEYCLPVNQKQIGFLLRLMESENSPLDYIELMELSSVVSDLRDLNAHGDVRWRMDAILESPGLKRLEEEVSKICHSYKIEVGRDPSHCSRKYISVEMFIKNAEYDKIYERWHRLLEEHVPEQDQYYVHGLFDIIDDPDNMDEWDTKE